MTDRPYLIERVGPAAVVQLYADAFADLALPDKVLSWHLYEAALAGRDIYYDQRYRHALLMRDVLETLFVHRDRLGRFGTECVEAALSATGRTLLVVHEGEEQLDLVQDFVDVVTSMCARLYGRRSASHRAKRAVAAAAETD